VNDRYLDRNYGGILILWDRLFGTFVEENDADPPVFGTRSPLRSWNPLWANLEVYWATAKDMWHARRWRDKLLVWIKPPGWRPADVAARFPKPEFDIGRAIYDPPIPRALSVYCLGQFVLLLAMSVHFLGVATGAPLATALAYGAYLVAALWVLGALMEGRRWAAWVEALRVLGTALVPALAGRWFAVAHLAPAYAVAIPAVFGASALALLWLAWRPAAPVGAGQVAG
jgi:hypothetical protein